MPLWRRLGPPARWLVRSVASRLMVVMIVAGVVPVLIYQELRAVDDERKAVVLSSAQQQGSLIARLLIPILQRADNTDLPHLGDELARFADPHTGLKLLVRPRAVAGVEGFFYVAAAPFSTGDPVNPHPPVALDLEAERQQLIDDGVLANLSDRCAGNQSLARLLRTPGGRVELLTSISTVNTDFGCWVIITAHDTGGYLSGAATEPYWQTPEIRAATLIYLCMVALVAVLFGEVWLNLRRFGRAARRLRSGRAGEVSFVASNRVPELNWVAEDMDRAVATLRHSAESLRRAAEDNAHAFKTPIAVIRQSLEPLRRLVPETEARGSRAIELIDQALDRLDGLVSFARRLDETNADLLQPPRRKVDLGQVVLRIVAGYDVVLTARHITLNLRVAQRCIVRAGAELLETVIANVIDNAISFSPPGSTMSIRVTRAEHTATVSVADEGPGVDPAHISRIFERYFSLRPGDPLPQAPTPTPADGEVPHYGIGLWIVRRNIEAIGGTVEVANRAAGGLIMTIHLPLAS